MSSPDDPRIARFVALLHHWNDRINLTGATTREDIEEHVADSMHVIPFVQGERVLDVGSGAGFPVVIAALALPQARFIALEPVHKKHAFLRTVARELALANLEPLAERLDDHRGDDYDTAMSRATFELPEWLALGIARVRPGGVVLGFEGQPRSDLPATIERRAYRLADKQRAIIVLHR
jgi:16S rRNA (guanine527-N7)-methyltransferase